MENNEAKIKYVEEKLAEIQGDIKYHENKLREKITDKELYEKQLELLKEVK